MKSQTGNMLTMMAAAIGALALVTGCESQSKSAESKPKFHHSGNTEFIGDEGQSRIVHGVADHQAMLGAQADPTLYACHFDGAFLNGLGRAKLDAMLADGATSRVYIDSGKSNADAHRAAVSAHLAAANRADGSIAVESGAAPSSLAPAAPSIARMGKSENPGKSSASNQSTGTSMGTSNAPLFGQ